MQAAIQRGPADQDDSQPPGRPWLSSLLPEVPGEGARGSVGPLTYRVRTRLHFDLVDPRLGDVGASLDASFDESTDVRRARILADFGFAPSSPFRRLSLRSQFDFADSTIDWKDLVGQLQLHGDAGVGRGSNLRFGQLREPFGLEAMTSVSHLPFIERSIASEAFTPRRSRGVQWSARWERALVQLGHFRRADGLPFPNELLQESATTLRMIHQREDEGLAQVGASVSVRTLNGDPLRLGGRPGTRLLPRIVDTGDLDAEGAVTSGVEALHRRGRWTAYGEWFAAWIDVDGPNAVVTGGHVAGSVFLGAGATRWHRTRGGLRAPSVGDAWNTGTSGAVEAALRVTWIDLSDGAVRGGRSLDVEAGINWYVQPATRLMLHWVGLRSDAPCGRSELGSVVLARLQVQF